MHSDDGLGEAMSRHYAQKAGDDALKEVADLRRQMQFLTNRVAYLERLANIDPNIAVAS